VSGVLLFILILLLLPGLWQDFWLLGLAIMLLLAVNLLNRFWLVRATRKVKLSREIPEQAFTGDTLEVKVSAHNGGKLPLPWVNIYDFVPTGLNPTPRPEWLLTLRGEEKVNLSYSLECRRRGRYHVGPMEGSAGVIFDTEKDPSGRRLNWGARSRLTVFPQVVPLERLLLPSRLPLGNIRTRQPLLPDPSRIAGVREYVPGDDPRYIDWRNTARLDTLLVKQFERTRIIPLAIFLDLKPPNLAFSWRQAAEASISVAASLAVRANELRQSFGLYSNGYDPGWDETSFWNEVIRPEFLPPGEGRPEMRPRTGTVWLYEVLDKLAGIQVKPNGIALEMVAGHWSTTLPWGSTIAVISFQPYPELVTECSRLRRAGFTILPIFTGRGEYFSQETGDALEAIRALGMEPYEIKHPGELNKSVKSSK
jgi:uncharacterized protein (DUF58 family)